jgi:hypothetical protein
MSFWRYLGAGLSVAFISVAYNYFVFSFFDFYPGFSGAIEIFSGYPWLNFYVLLFLKNFIGGLILMYLFAHAYQNIYCDNGNGKNEWKGIMFFILFGIFALLFFAFSDFIFFESYEKIFLFLTLDGVVEGSIVTLPLKFFHEDACKRL